MLLLLQQSAWLRSALAEREAQLEELQDQHVRLVVSTCVNHFKLSKLLPDENSIHMYILLW